MSDNNGKAVGLQMQLRQLPSVDRLLQSAAAADLVEAFGRGLVVTALRHALEAARTGVISGKRPVPMNATLLQEAREWLEALLAPTLSPVVNGTGVIIHTNLGRAPLSKAAIEAVTAVAGGYAALEYDVAAGKRGSRAVHAAELLTRLTGAEAAFVVNNNAAAVVLALRALCAGREVVISRGQLVEIGGGFRIPDVMAESGARLVEVGTTNRTHLRDYRSAINQDTAAIMVAHHSNFKIVGFTAEPELAELCALAREEGILLIYDQGSGAFLDTAPYGLAHEPTVQEGVQAGADLVTFSGDKLLGGPQAGIVCGRADLVERVRRHPLARAVRADKLALAALAETLRHFLVDAAEKEIPVWQMIARPVAELESVAAAWASDLNESNIAATVIEGKSAVGGGSLPGTTLPTRLLAIAAPDVGALATALRREQSPPVIGRVQDDRLLIDVRTVLPEQEGVLLAALKRAH